MRDYLTKLVDEQDRQKRALAELREIFRNSRYEMGPKTWTREDLYDRH